MAAPDSRLALTPNYAQWPKVTDHPQVGEAEIYHVKVKPDPCPNDQRTAGPSSKALPVTPRKNVVSQPRNPPDDLQVIFAPRSYPDVVFDTPTAILGPDQNPDFPLRGPHAPKPRRTDALHTPAARRTTAQSPAIATMTAATVCYSFMPIAIFLAGGLTAPFWFNASMRAGLTDNLGVNAIYYATPFRTHTT